MEVAMGLPDRWSLFKLEQLEVLQIMEIFN